MSQQPNVPVRSYTWSLSDADLISIKNAKNEESIRSIIFNLHPFKCELEIYPNGASPNRKGTVGLFLNIHIPPKIDIIHAKYSLKVHETDTKHSSSPQFTQERKGKGWRANKLNSSRILNLKNITISTTLQVIGIYDKKGKDITYEYLKNDEMKQQSVDSIQMNNALLASLSSRMDEMTNLMTTLQQKVNDIELRLNEEQKNDDKIDKVMIMKELNLIKQNMKVLSKNNNINPEQQRLKAWLQNTVKLPQYYDLFLQNGIDELSVVALIDKETLKEMGIDTIGHQIKILDKAKQLKQNNNNNPAFNEGGPTAYI
eukprot:33758_1